MCEYGRILEDDTLIEVWQWKSLMKTKFWPCVYICICTYTNVVFLCITILLNHLKYLCNSQMDVSVT